MAAQITVAFLFRRVDCNDGGASHGELFAHGLKARGHRVLFLSGPVRGQDVFADRYASLRDAVEDWIVLDGFDPRGRPCPACAA